MVKLTLSVDKEVVAQAKRYAARRRTSVSRLVEQYLHLLARARPKPGQEPPPVLARLRGALRAHGAVQPTIGATLNANTGEATPLRAERRDQGQRRRSHTGSFGCLLGEASRGGRHGD